MAERRSKRNIRKSAEIIQLESIKEAKAHTKKVGGILKKSANERTEAEKILLKDSSDVIKTLEQRARTREKQKLRVQEYEDTNEVLQSKCGELAQELLNCRYAIVYTGAGISTAASIPDYRGPNGVWTLLKKGIEPGAVDLSDADPTFTHMSVSHLYSKGLVKYVVSQNCDGLHMRSGLPRNVLSELHGNMFIEMCLRCQPVEEHVRLFDTTERTGLRRHKTGRQCRRCGGDLKDSIVHFGEKGPFHAPYNWKEASEVADQADLILCLGSSLKVLRRYPCLWNMQKPVKERPKLVIVNLQWTPKDDLAFLKINGKCDDVMRLLMQKLSMSVPKYDRDLDPIYAYAMPLKPSELNTVSKKVLVEPPEYEKDTVLNIMKTLGNMRVNINYSSSEEDCEKKSPYNHKMDYDSISREVVAKTERKPCSTRAKTGKATARKSPCKLVLPRENGDCTENLSKLEEGKCSDSIRLQHVKNHSPSDHPVNSIKEDTNKVVEMSQQNGYTSINSRTTSRSMRTKAHHYVENVNQSTEKLSQLLPIMSLDVECEDIRRLRNCSVLLDRNVVNDYLFKNAQENFTPSGMVKARVLYKQTLRKCGEDLPRCKGKESCVDNNKDLEEAALSKFLSPVSPGSASRRKRSRPSRSLSTEGQGEDPSEKKQRRDLDILGNDVFAGLDSSDSDDSLSSATIEVSIPSILKTGTKCKTLGPTQQKLHKSKLDSKASMNNQNISNDGSITNDTTHNFSQPGSSTSGNASLNVPGGEALSFLAMEEACELPDLTLDSRKVWACYSSWFTALYQSLELKRDESTRSQSQAVQMDPSAIRDPEVLSTAKEQNTVLLANLAVHDLDSEQMKEQQEMLMSGLSSPDLHYTGVGPLLYNTSAGGTSPFYSLDRSGSQSPRGMRVGGTHRNSSTSQGRDSISVCSSIASPREITHSQGSNPDSLRQPVFAESQQVTSSISEQQYSDHSNTGVSEEPTTLQGNSCVGAGNTNTSTTSPQLGNSPTPQDAGPTMSFTGTEAVVQDSNNTSASTVTFPPVVMNPTSPLEHPAIIISPVPMIDVTDADGSEQKPPERQLTRRQSLLQQQPMSPNANDLSQIVQQRRNSLPASLVTSHVPQMSLSTGENSNGSSSALFAFPEGATGRGPYRPRGRPPNKPGSPVHDPNDAISRIVKRHIENIKEKTATIVETKDQVMKTMGSSAPGWFGKGCRINKRRKKSR